MLEASLDARQPAGNTLTVGSADTAITCTYTNTKRGTITLNGAPVEITSPIAAQKLGITLIHQEPISFPDLSVADNIAISNPPKRFGLIDRRAQRLVHLPQGHDRA